MSDPEVPPQQPASTPPPAAVPAPAAAAAPAAVPAPAVTAAPQGVALVSIDEFFKIKLVTGEVISAENHPKADRLLVVQVKVGDQVKQIVSGIRQFYTAEQMVGKTIVVVNNLQPTKLRGVESFGMLLAVKLPEGGLRLVTVDGPTPPGLEVS